MDITDFSCPAPGPSHNRDTAAAKLTGTAAGGRGWLGEVLQQAQARSGICTGSGRAESAWARGQVLVGLLDHAAWLAGHGD
jgi:hypothetical protein